MIRARLFSFFVFSSAGHLLRYQYFLGLAVLLLLLFEALLFAGLALVFDWAWFEATFCVVDVTLAGAADFGSLELSVKFPANVSTHIAPYSLCGPQQTPADL